MFDRQRAHRGDVWLLPDISCAFAFVHGMRTLVLSQASRLEPFESEAPISELATYCTAMGVGVGQPNLSCPSVSLMDRCSSRSVRWHIGHPCSMRHLRDRTQMTRFTRSPSVMGRAEWTRAPKCKTAWPTPRSCEASTSSELAINRHAESTKKGLIKAHASDAPHLPVVKVRWSVAGARATRDSEDSKFSAGKIEA